MNMQKDIFENDHDLRLLTVVKRQLVATFTEATSKPNPPDWFSMRALFTQEARALSQADYAKAEDLEIHYHDRLCQITGKTPRVCTGVYTTDDWLTVLEEH